MASPRNQRSDAFANVHRIVAAAREVFGREGDAATLSQVAAAAGVANATLYRHFANRRALAAAVYEDIVVNDIKPAILALGNDAPRESFIDALAHLEDVMFRQRPLLASIGDLAELTTQLLMRDREQFEDMIMQAQATGELRPDITSDDVATFIAMVTTASVALNQPQPLRRRYLSLMFDSLSTAPAVPLPPVAPRTRAASGLTTPVDG